MALGSWASIRLACFMKKLSACKRVMCSPNSNSSYRNSDMIGLEVGTHSVYDDQKVGTGKIMCDLL